MTERLDLVFLGTSSFAVPVLEALLASPHRVLAVVTRPPRPAGRGRKLAQPPVYRFMEGLNGPPVLQPRRLDAEFIGRVAELSPRVMVTASYGAWLPGEFLEAAPLGVVNVHPSLLPMYRGAAPVTRAILDGREETGVSFMLTDAGWDTGPLLAVFRERIRKDDTSGSLEERLALLASEKMAGVLENYARGELKPVPQSGEASYAEKISMEETWLDWNLPAHVLERMVRAFRPVPGARTSLKGRLLKIVSAGLRDGELPPGSVTAEGGILMVGCGDGHCLEILRLQPESKKVMTAGEFMRGGGIRTGDLLEKP